MKTTKEIDDLLKAMYDEGRRSLAKEVMSEMRGILTNYGLKNAILVDDIEHIKEIKEILDD